jgi:segregation and condensation protein B
MTTPEDRDHETMDQTLIRRIVEAALLAAPQPLTLAQLAGLFPDEEQPPKDSLELAIEALREDCADRGVELVEVASGFRFQVKADVHAWVARLWTERQTKYTRATLETLALIAYRQPITRGEIEQIRGVSVNANMIKMLEEREWIRSVGHRDVPGRPELFGTTKAFLDYFGLKSLDELPPLAELKDIPELEPQLPFDMAPAGVASAALAANLEEEVEGGGHAMGEEGHDDTDDSDDEEGNGHFIADDEDFASEGDENNHHDTGVATTTDAADADGDGANPSDPRAGDTAEPEQK